MSITATVTTPDAITATVTQTTITATATASQSAPPALILKTGQTTVYTAGDNGTYQVGQAHAYNVLTIGQYSGTTNITLNGKTEAKSNECVYDASTGLMWSRTLSGSVGAASNGLLAFTANANGEGAFTYATAVNAASFAGFTDWRVPNVFEVFAQGKHAAGSNPLLDTVTVPTIPASAIVMTSTSAANSPTNFVNVINFSIAIPTAASKTAASYYVWLVRGVLATPP